LIMARYRALIVSAAEAATTALQGDASACSCALTRVAGDWSNRPML